MYFYSSSLEINFDIRSRVYIIKQGEYFNVKHLSRLLMLGARLSYPINIVLSIISKNALIFL